MYVNIVNMYIEFVTLCMCISVYQVGIITCLKVAFPTRIQAEIQNVWDLKRVISTCYY